MLIGSRVMCKDNGIKGKVIDETRNTLVLEVAGKRKTLMKSGNRFVVESGGKTLRIRGNDIRMRPWEYAL